MANLSREEKNQEILNLQEKIKVLEEEIKEIQKWTLDDIEEYIMTRYNGQGCEFPNCLYNLTQMRISKDDDLDDIKDVTKHLQLETYFIHDFEEFKSHLHNYIRFIFLWPSKEQRELLNSKNDDRIRSKFGILFRDQIGIQIRMHGITSEHRINALRNE